MSNPTFADWQAVAGSLGLKRVGKELVGPCPRPICGGTNRFRVNAHGFYCRECAPDGKTDPAILREIQEAAGLWQSSEDRVQTTIRRHPYRNAAGKVLVTIERNVGPDGKTVGRPWHKPSGVDKPEGGWPLYLGQDVASNPDAHVLIVEGEKTAEAVRQRVEGFENHYVGVTSKGGAGQSHHTDWSAVRGRAVTIWPDAHDVGRKYGKAVARACLAAEAVEVRIVNTDGLPDKWDLADPIPAGLDVEGRLSRAAPFDKNTADAPGAELRVDNDWSHPPARRLWLANGWLARGRLAILTGRGTVGKSKLAVMLADAIAAGASHWFDGGPALDLPGACPVVFASWEDDRDEIARRLFDNPALKRGGAPELAARVGDRLHFADMAGLGPLWEPDPRGSRTGDGAGVLSPAGAALRAYCEDKGARLLVLDPLAACFALNENNRGAARGFLSNFDRWGRDADCTILIVAHPPKPKGDGADDRYSGSTDWRNAPRAVLYMRHDKATGLTELIADKVSYAKAPELLRLNNWKWWQAAPWEPKKAASPPQDNPYD